MKEYSYWPAETLSKKLMLLERKNRKIDFLLEYETIYLISFKFSKI